jgi:hypothetical protein
MSKSICPSLWHLDALGGRISRTTAGCLTWPKNALVLNEEAHMDGWDFLMGIVNIVPRLPLSFTMVAGHRDEVMV